MLIPGLTLVQKPLETYLIVRESDGDRELSPGECRLLYDLAAGSAARPMREALEHAREKIEFIVGAEDCGDNELLAEIDAALAAPSEVPAATPQEPMYTADQVREATKAVVAKQLADGTIALPAALIEKCAGVCDRWIASKNLHEHLAATDVARDIRSLSPVPRPNRGEGLE